MLGEVNLCPESGITQVLPSTRTRIREKHSTQNQCEPKFLLADEFALEKQLPHDFPS